jgi:hypothetical protein
LIFSHNNLSDATDTVISADIVLGFSNEPRMKSIPEVEAAKALMNEAASWSVMKWMREKKRVRKTADEANAALDSLNRSIQTRWDEKITAAYQELVPNSRGAPVSSAPTDREIKALAKKIKQADDEARRARDDAEDTFNRAEKQLSTVLAREGCRKAIRSWELYESAIAKAEIALQSK